MRTLAGVVLSLSALPLPAQSLLYSYSLPASWYVVQMRPAGDTNGDGKQDFVALVRQISPTANVPTVVIVSGATGAPLHTLPEPGLQNDRDALGIGDVDGDGRSDVMLVTATLVRVYPGSTGQVLWSLPVGGQNQSFRTACGIGDHNGNGTADAAIAVHDSGLGSVTLRLVRGENGSSLGTLVTLPGNYLEVTLRAMGDLTGDGKTEIAYSRALQFTDVLNGVTGAVLWSLNPPGNDGGRTIDTVDLDGDGKQELFFFRPTLYGPGFAGVTTVHDAMTGAMRFERNGPVNSGYATSVAPVGDLDQDGAQDFAQVLYTNGASSVLAASGTAGRRLWSLPNWPPAQGLSLVVGLGDVDGDSYGDFAVLRSSTLSDGWCGMSGRILAESQPQGGACGGGPFFPQLGSTRPILGQPLTIAGQNGPPGVGGVLVFSLQPPAPTWLGASTCFAWFDLGAGIALAPLTQSQWSLAVPLPLVPQFAGLEIALQAFWSPTAGPLGYDLSNGVWARLGYQ